MWMNRRPDFTPEPEPKRDGWMYLVFWGLGPVIVVIWLTVLGCL